MPRHTTEERKAQIINEAIMIIHEEGYYALSIRVLADRVGISEPAVYRHFLNKDEIIKGILDKIYHFGNHLFDKISKEPNFKEKIKKFMLYHFEYFETHPEMTSVVFSEDIFLHNEVLEAKLGELMKQRKRMLKKIFEEAKQEGLDVEGDPEDISLIIMGIVRITVLEWRMSGFTYSLKRRGMKLLKTMEGIGFLSLKAVDG